ncbi:hypothetical protein SAMN06265346_104233 [Flavobacterium hercynium]|nr:hypothetical protein SAMN06265346_104233 [Flavobacterium hercynium]
MVLLFEDLADQNNGLNLACALFEILKHDKNEENWISGRNKLDINIRLL